MPDHGQTVELTITDLSFGGAGVGRSPDGEVVFVPFTAAGDRVAVRITESHRRFARGEVLAMVEAGPGRTRPECPHFGRCGGCSYQHLDYDTEIRAKQGQLESVLKRIGGLKDLPELPPPVRSPQVYGYRNKITLEPIVADRRPTDEHLDYGYCETDNRRFFPVEACPLARDVLNAMIQKIPRTKWGRKNAQRPRPHPMTLRVSHDGRTYGYFGRAPARIPWLKEELLEREISVPLGAFWQINGGVADALFGTVRLWAREHCTRWLVDAYAGVGTFSLAAGDGFARRILIEEDRQALQAAEYNHSQSALRAHCVAGRTESVLGSVARRLNPAETTVILDPPRSGCADGAIAALRGMRPVRILYVSCNAATLARDLKTILAGDMYGVDRIALFDMFPRTAHFETAALLTRR